MTVWSFFCGASAALTHDGAEASHNNAASQIHRRLELQSLDLLTRLTAGGYSRNAKAFFFFFWKKSNPLAMNQQQFDSFIAVTDVVGLVMYLISGCIG